MSPATRFTYLHVNLPGATAIVYEPGLWAGVLLRVVVGSIVVEDCSGCEVRLDTGAVFCVDGLSVRAIRNPGNTPATLVGVCRQAGRDEFTRGLSSSWP